MEFVHEVTAYLENKPGRLAKICAALEHERVNIQALSVKQGPFFGAEVDKVDVDV